MVKSHLLKNKPIFLELIYLIKKGGHQPIRPDLATDDLEINSALVINYSNKLDLTNTPN